MASPIPPSSQPIEQHGPTPTDAAEPSLAQQAPLSAAEQVIRERAQRLSAAQQQPTLVDRQVNNTPESPAAPTTSAEIPPAEATAFTPEQQQVLADTAQRLDAQYREQSSAAATSAQASSAAGEEEIIATYTNLTRQLSQATSRNDPNLKELLGQTLLSATQASGQHPGVTTLRTKAAIREFLSAYRAAYRVAHADTIKTKKDTLLLKYGETIASDICTNQSELETTLERRTKQLQQDIDNSPDGRGIQYEADEARHYANTAKEVVARKANWLARIFIRANDYRDDFRSKGLMWFARLFSGKQMKKYLTDTKTTISTALKAADAATVAETKKNTQIEQAIKYAFIALFVLDKQAATKAALQHNGGYICQKAKL